MVGLSILVRGNLDEKLRWTFSLYDQDRDGLISRSEIHTMRYKPHDSLTIFNNGLF